MTALPLHHRRQLFFFFVFLKACFLNCVVMRKAATRADYTYCIVLLGLGVVGLAVVCSRTFDGVKLFRIGL